VIAALTDYLNTASVPSEVQPGDFVAFSSHAGFQVRVDGKDYLLIRADAIEAVWQEPAEIEAVAV
jgi:co-chaperonin GroES (HSP10)